MTPLNVELKIALVESGLKLVELMRITKIHDSRLSRIFNGHVQATKYEQRVIAQALKRNIKDLFPSRRGEAVA